MIEMILRDKSTALFGFVEVTLGERIQIEMHQAHKHIL